ncbi:hypothetical protein AC578_5199 [Pseudocercospora eumusae]|uniref:Uncharacterized protein n=1 Tax=Pseudocercospora eumusae TaxID=321146 RepID=A0A139H0D2_9PEZI|nr:hypothetical protein AC578_5199 [Pseudocercospora eumusae]
MQSRLQTLQLENSRLKDENRSLHEENRILDERLESAETALNKASAEAWRRLEPSYYAPMALSDIRYILRHLFLDADFAAEEACKGLTLNHALRHVDLLDDLLFPSQEAFRDALSKSIIMQKRPETAATLILSAVVHNRMCGMLCDPFFAFVGRPSDPVLRSRSKESMVHMLDLIRSHDGEGAEGLRWRLLRLLDPRNYHPDQARAGVKNIAKASRAYAADIAARDIVNMAKDLVPAKFKKELLHNLREVFGELADFTWELWVRKACIQPVFWSDLVAREGTQSLVYNSKSNNMDRHSSNNGQFSRDPAGFEGRDVIFLHCCGIEIVGSQEDGNKYDEWRQKLRPAIVWMG